MQKSAIKARDHSFLCGKFSQSHRVNYLARRDIQVTFFLDLFFCFEKYCFQQGKGATLWKVITITFPICFSREQKNVGTCCMCKTERCQNWNMTSTSDKEGSYCEGSVRRKKGASPPSADGSFIVMAAGGRTGPKAETRDHKKGWRHGWTLTHVPQWRGILLT